MKLVFLLFLTALTGCNTLKYYLEDPEMEKIKAQVRALHSSAFYGPGMRALKNAYPNEDTAELIITLAKYLREEKKDKSIDALSALKAIASIEIDVAEALVKSGKDECSQDAINCLDLREFEASYAPLLACKQGDAKACALRALETQHLFSLKSLYFAKLACVHGNPAGCEMMHADHESKERSKDRIQSRAVFIWVDQ